MIEECNFKGKDYTSIIGKEKYRMRCDLSNGKCLGEDKCILFQMYKSLSSKNEFMEGFKKGIEE